MSLGTNNQLSEIRNPCVDRILADCTNAIRLSVWKAVKPLLDRADVLQSSQAGGKSHFTERQCACDACQLLRDLIKVVDYGTMALNGLLIFGSRRSRLIH